MLEVVFFRILLLFFKRLYALYAGFDFVEILTEKNTKIHFIILFISDIEINLKSWEEKHNGIIAKQGNQGSIEKQKNF